MRWMWIDRVVALTPRERIVAIKNISLAEEHLHAHFAAVPARGEYAGAPALPVMPASLIIEGVAQTGGVLVGHSDGFRQKIVLAKINRAALDREAGPGTTLRYTATVERMDLQGAAIAATIALLDHAAPALGFVDIGRVEMMFSFLDHNMGGAGRSGADFPEDNFVFGEAFQTLLASSGF